MRPDERGHEVRCSAMLHLSAFVQPDSTSEVCDGLSSIPGVRRVMVGSVTTDGFVNITAHLEAGSADAAIDLLAHHDVGADDVGLLRLPVLLPLMVRRRGTEIPMPRFGPRWSAGRGGTRTSGPPIWCS